MSLNTQVDNAVDLEHRQRYAAILGANPSQGARSPSLWNAAFRAHDIEAEMIPLDVSAPNLDGVMTYLEQDQRFIGGAVAVPHKQSLAGWLHRRSPRRLSKEAALIGAVNCLYRGPGGELCGTNTDGEGAQRSLHELSPDYAQGKVVLVGLGGAGKAVAAYVAGAMSERNRLVVANRTHSAETGTFTDGIGVKLVEWPAPPDCFDDVRTVINCTTIGSNMTQEVSGQCKDLCQYTPLAELDDRNAADSLKILRRLSPDAVVFDIIYDPSPTLFLRLAGERGCRQLDGGPMNLEQAVLAFRYAVADSAPGTTRQAMQAEKERTEGCE